MLQTCLYDVCQFEYSSSSLYCNEQLPPAGEEFVFNLSAMSSAEGKCPEPAQEETREMETQNYGGWPGTSSGHGSASSCFYSIREQTQHKKRVLARSDAFRDSVPWGLSTCSCGESCCPVCRQGGQESGDLRDRGLGEIQGCHTFQEVWPICACGGTYLNRRVSGHGIHCCRSPWAPGNSPEEAGGGAFMVSGESSYEVDSCMGAHSDSGGFSEVSEESYEMDEQEYPSEEEI